MGIDESRLVTHLECVNPAATKLLSLLTRLCASYVQPGEEECADAFRLPALRTSGVKLANLADDKVAAPAVVPP